MLLKDEVVLGNTLVELPKALPPKMLPPDFWLVGVLAGVVVAEPKILEVNGLELFELKMLVFALVVVAPNTGVAEVALPNSGLGADNPPKTGLAAAVPPKIGWAAVVLPKVG